jgi:uncharacterized protein YcfJ
MKKTILALAVAGITPLFAAETNPAPAALAPQTTYGDVARVTSSLPVYEKVAFPRRECVEGGYTAAASEIKPCDEVADARERIVGYDVTYQYNGREFRIRMPYEPGDQIAVNVEVRPPLPREDRGPRNPRYRGPY